MNKKEKLPKLSINIITFNSAEKLNKSLTFLKKQNYPKEKIEVVLIDGGSKDNTIDVALRFKNNFQDFKIVNTKIIDQEPKRAIAAIKSAGKYIVSLDPDVYLTDANWLQTMIEPLERDDSLTGAQTLYYHYLPHESLINRYFALFGVNDPVVFYLNKADRIPHYKKKWLFNDNYQDVGNYFKVKFDQEIPTMGCNGVVFRRDHYLKTGFSKETFFHIDVIQDLVKMGFNKFAIVKNSVLHSTGSNFWQSILKRTTYMDTHYFKRQYQRRYLVFDPKSKKDLLNLMLFIFYTLTFVQPFLLSLKGFIKKRDFAWFLHWPMCFGFLIIYGWSITKKLIK